MDKEFKIQYTVFQNKETLSDDDRKLYNAALDSRAKAYAPYSKFHVGCAMLLEDGQIIVANNQENAAYPSGLCAERSAIFWAASNFPNIAIKKIFVIGGAEVNPASTPIPPCGACRQSILEYESKQNKNIELFFTSVEGEVIKTNSVRDLLPFSFDASYL